MGGYIKTTLMLQYMAGLISRPRGTSNMAPAEGLSPDQETFSLITQPELGTQDLSLLEGTAS